MNGNAMEQFWAARESEAFDAAVIQSGRVAAIRQVAEMATPEVSRAGATTVDLGCGTGLFAEAVGGGSIIGVDFSPRLLDRARTRMDSVCKQDIFDLHLKPDSIDNIISLFVIDDYAAERKRFFFTSIFSFLRPGGSFFFAAYSPRDQQMGPLRHMKPLPFQVHLEPLSFYETTLKQCGYSISCTEVLHTAGEMETSSGLVQVEREFFLFSARKAGSK